MRQCGTPIKEAMSNIAHGGVHLVTMRPSCQTSTPAVNNLLGGFDGCAVVRANRGSLGQEAVSNALPLRAAQHPIRVTAASLRSLQLCTACGMIAATEQGPQSNAACRQGGFP